MSNDQLFRLKIICKFCPGFVELHYLLWRKVFEEIGHNVVIEVYSVQLSLDVQSKMFQKRSMKL